MNYIYREIHYENLKSVHIQLLSYTTYIYIDLDRFTFQSSQKNNYYKFNQTDKQTYLRTSFISKNVYGSWFICCLFNTYHNLLSFYPE